MTDLHRCPRCEGCAWSVEREDKSVVVVCMLCGTRVLISDGRAEARDAELAAVRGRHEKHGPKPKGSRDGR